jgi:hypothetical protein
LIKDDIVVRISNRFKVEGLNNSSISYEIFFRLFSETENISSPDLLTLKGGARSLEFQVQKLELVLTQYVGSVGPNFIGEKMEFLLRCSFEV